MGTFHTPLGAVLVTVANRDSVLALIQAEDQRKEVLIGNLISHIVFTVGPQMGCMTIWHDEQQAAISYQGNASQWGEWDGQVLTADVDGFLVSYRPDGMIVE